MSLKVHPVWVTNTTCLIQNKMVEYQFYPPVSWLDYHLTIDDYQWHIPDPQLWRDQPLWHIEISSSSDESEGWQLSEDEEILFTDTKEAPVTRSALGIDQHRSKFCSSKVELDLAMDHLFQQLIHRIISSVPVRALPSHLPLQNSSSSMSQRRSPTPPASQHEQMR